LLEEWIKSGALDPRVLVTRPNVADWWSLKPLPRKGASQAPQAVENRLSLNPVDAFIRAKLTERHLTPSPEADRGTLIRRVMFDLHGLPPSFEEVAAFVKDADPKAYEKLVDRLLESPRYGERLGAALAGYDSLRGDARVWPRSAAGSCVALSRLCH